MSEINGEVIFTCAGDSNIIGSFSSSCIEDEVLFQIPMLSLWIKPKRLALINNRDRFKMFCEDILHVQEIGGEKVLCFSGTEEMGMYGVFVKMKFTKTSGEIEIISDHYSSKFEIRDIKVI